MKTKLLLSVSENACPFCFTEMIHSPAGADSEGRAMAAYDFCPCCFQTRAGKRLPLIECPYCKDKPQLWRKCPVCSWLGFVPVANWKKILNPMKERD